MTGTESLLQLADQLDESVEHVQGGYHLGQAAERMERAAKAIRRLAQFEPDLQDKCVDLPAAAALEPVAYRHLHEDGYEYYDAPTGEDCDGCEPLVDGNKAAELRSGKL